MNYKYAYSIECTYVDWKEPESEYNLKLEQANLPITISDDKTIRPNFCSNYELTDCIITDKHINSDNKLEKELYYYLLYSRFSELRSSLHNYFIKNEEIKPFEISVKLKSTYINVFELNKDISNELYIFFKLVEVGLGLHETPLLKEEIYQQYNKNILNRKDSFSLNYFYIIYHIDYLCHIKKNIIKVIEYIKFIALEIIRIIDVDNINRYSKLGNISNQNMNYNKYILYSNLEHIFIRFEALMQKLFWCSHLTFKHKINYSITNSKQVNRLKEDLDDLLKLYKPNVKEVKSNQHLADNKNILKGHFKFSRDNEHYLFDYLNELYNIFNIGDKKLCKQNKLGGICAAIYESKVITNCNTFSECMRLLCAYWQRETPKDCRLNKYQDAKQELLDKHRILNEIPLK